jgi:glycerol-3-phosphate acyltransferase PlsX
VVKRIYAKHDYHEFGGAPLLGANGVCMICHGSSEARTITSSVKAAINYMKHEVNEGIIEALSETSDGDEAAA